MYAHKYLGFFWPTLAHICIYTYIYRHHPTELVSILRLTTQQTQRIEVMAELAKQEVDTIGKERGTGKTTAELKARNGMECVQVFVRCTVAVPEGLGPGDSSFWCVQGEIRFGNSKSSFDSQLQYFFRDDTHAILLN